MVGLFSTTVLREVCITFRASLIEVSIVYLMLLFKRSSISYNSWFLLVVIFAISHSSIFIISVNIVLAVLPVST